MFRLTAEKADDLGMTGVTPWVALASGYRRITSDVDGQYWVSDWDYDLYYSWQIGAELNDPSYGDAPNHFAPWHSAEIVVLYPPPFRETIPHWSKHFVAYVRGANGVTELPE